MIFSLGKNFRRFDETRNNSFRLIFKTTLIKNYLSLVLGSTRSDKAVPLPEKLVIPPGSVHRDSLTPTRDDSDNHTVALPEAEEKKFRSPAQNNSSNVSQDRYDSRHSSESYLRANRGSFLSVEDYVLDWLGVGS